MLPPAMLWMARVLQLQQRNSSRVSWDRSAVRAHAVVRLRQLRAPCRHHPTSCAVSWVMLMLLLLSSLKAAAVTWTSAMVRGRQVQAVLPQALSAAQRAAGLASSTSLMLLTSTTGMTLLKAADTEAVVSHGLNQGMEAAGASAAAADRLTGIAVSAAGGMAPAGAGHQAGIAAGRRAAESAASAVGVGAMAASRLKDGEVTGTGAAGMFAAEHVRATVAGRAAGIGVTDAGAAVGAGVGVGVATGMAAVEQLTGSPRHVTGVAVGMLKDGATLRHTRAPGTGVTAAKGTRMGTLNLIQTAAVMLTGQLGTAEGMSRLGAAAGEAGAAAGLALMLQGMPGVMAMGWLSTQQERNCLLTGRSSSLMWLAGMGSRTLLPAQLCCWTSSAHCWLCCARLSVSCSRLKVCPVVLTGGSWIGPGREPGRQSYRQLRWW